MTYLDQCGTCHYWHEEHTDDDGWTWAPFCDLFHGNGIAVPCDQHMTEDEHQSLKESLQNAKYEKSVKFDTLRPKEIQEEN